MTALILASRRGHVDIVRLLLDRGASVDSTDNVSHSGARRRAGKLRVVRSQLFSLRPRARFYLVLSCPASNRDLPVSQKGMDALACCSCSECQTLLRGSERLQQWHRRHSLVTWGHAAVRQRLRSALACRRRESWK